MKGIRNRCLAYAAAAAFALLSILSLPHLYSLVVRRRLFRIGSSEHRKTVARWSAWWGTLAFRVVTRILDVKVEFRLPEGIDAHDRERPFIVIANHQSSLDILVMVGLMAELGRIDFRWILKRQLFSAPAIGRACKEMECGYVTRDGDGHDLDRVRRCAAVARYDGSSVIIFPEGTRFVSPKVGSGYARVLPPKTGGVRMLRHEMPDHPVLSVTIGWNTDENGKTMFDGASYVGRTVTVECAVIDDIDDATVIDWLNDEWRRKDRRLVAAKR